MKDREIIQMTVSTGTGGQFDILYVLCDDKTIWKMVVDKGGSSKWKMLPHIDKGFHL